MFREQIETQKSMGKCEKKVEMTRRNFVDFCDHLRTQSFYFEHELTNFYKKEDTQSQISE